MSAVFADTSYYVALLLRTDSNHERAIYHTANHTGKVVSTAWVLLELGNFLSPVHLRPIFSGFIADLLLDPDAMILPPDPVQFDAGLRLYAERPDKAWSLVDSLSFLTMRDQGITDAWTSDHHFQQAGFNALLT